MNGHWNAYCAYTQSGRRKDRAHSTTSFRKAFARVYLLLHGGTADFLNTRLRRLGLPGVNHDFERNTLPDLKVIWNPQGYGSPNVPGNRAQAYYPGNGYVDVVGNDLYDIGGKAEWARERSALPRAPNEAIRLPRVGPLGHRRPRLRPPHGRLGSKARRLELLSWYESRAGSIFDLGKKPRSRAAYRRYITPLS